jgi:hypothetical protein
MRLGIAVLAAAVLSGAALAAPVKLPKTLTTPTGNFITLYAVKTAGGYLTADIKVCTSAHTPKGTMVIPSFYSVRLTNGASVHPGTPVKSPALGMVPLAAKQCTRGWLSFPLPHGAKPAAVVYTYGKPIVWPLT